MRGLEIQRVAGTTGGGTSAIFKWRLLALTELASLVGTTGVPAKLTVPSKSSFPLFGVSSAAQLGLTVLGKDS